MKTALYTRISQDATGKRAGVEWQAVAYKAIGNAWTDLYAGAIQFMFVDLTAGRGQVVAGKARPLALTLPQRSPLYPDLPTLAETVPEFASTGFLAIAVPKATPLPIQEKLNALIRQIADTQDLPLFSFHEVLADPARPARMRETLTDDGEHPSVEGYRLLGERAFRPF